MPLLSAVLANMVADNIPNMMTVKGLQRTQTDRKPNEKLKEIQFNE